MYLLFSVLSLHTEKLSSKQFLSAPSSSFCPPPVTRDDTPNNLILSIIQQRSLWREALTFSCYKFDFSTPNMLRIEQILQSNSCRLSQPPCLLFWWRSNAPQWKVKLTLSPTDQRRSSSCYRTLHTAEGRDSQRHEGTSLGLSDVKRGAGYSVICASRHSANIQIWQLLTKISRSGHSVRGNLQPCNPIRQKVLFQIFARIRRKLKAGFYLLQTLLLVSAIVLQWLERLLWTMWGQLWYLSQILSIVYFFTSSIACPTFFLVL